MSEKYKYNPRTLAYEPVKKVFFLPVIIARILIFIAVAYFLIGYLFVWLELFQLQKYINIAAIVGGIASTVSLLSLFGSRLQKSDFEKVGIEYLEEVVAAAKNLEEKEKALKDQEELLGVKEKELQELELKRAELELLVQRASLTIFLKDQLSRLESKIVDQIKSDKELSEYLLDRKETINRLKDLEIEIADDGKSKEIAEIVDLINSQKKAKKEVAKPKNIFEAFANVILGPIIRY